MVHYTTLFIMRGIQRVFLPLACQLSYLNALFVSWSGHQLKIKRALLDGISP